jgi:chromosome partitioning protein
MSDYFHGETINRRSVQTSDFRPNYKPSDDKYSKKCPSRWKAAKGHDEGVWTVQGSCIFIGKTGLGRAYKIRDARDEGGKLDSDSSTTSGVYRKKMGSSIRGENGKERMKTLVIANQKGGVGKTATLVHLAFDFLERGLKVAVVDLDTQANASYSLHDYSSGFFASQLFSGDFVGSDTLDETPRISLIASDASLANIEKLTLSEAGKQLRQTIGVLDMQGFDVCLIDTAPSLGISMASALLAADYVLSPIELEVYSIQGIKKMMTTVANLRKANTKLKFLGVVPSKVDSRNPRHGKHLAELRAAYPQFMFPASIGLRSSIADALALRVPVWKIKKTAARQAAKEIRALAQNVFNMMELNNVH